MNLESAFFVVEAIAELDTGAGITAAEVAVGVRMSERQTRRYLRDFRIHNLAQSVYVGRSHVPRWSLTEAGQGLLRAARG